MNYLYSFLALDLANQRRDDVFSMEYRQTQEADQARHAAELSASDGIDPRSLGERSRRASLR